MQDEDRRSDDWIEAREALNWARVAFRNYDMAKSLLEEALRNGKLCALADDIIVEPDMGKVGSWRKSKEIKVKRWYYDARPDRVNIIKGFWRQRSVSFYDDNLWNWEKNTFATTDEPEILLIYEEGEDFYTTKVGKRYVAFGVSFLHDEIKYIIDKNIRFSLIRPGSILRKPKWDWEKILSSYRAMILDRKLEEEFGPLEREGTQAKLEAAILQRAGEIDGKPPSETTVRRQAQRIIKEYKEQKNSTIEP
ncbi:hypothetical protein GCM10007897_38660 [Sphingobium jiangsuense]|uniref:Uncharacterized protein n=1 Tax=Sphingobium jiangsuense TaxID=870476 RepID=A0A7W6FNS4_9SPHN|nr:hypothetical protein [Sphingobium jiangsuense]MBB3924314.1 hypothetical protein [Sphingobium jiangsuense]GLT02456.1 hypothetical protein GCM10007897_38660 [Sphingobium jiangsuense]